MKNFFEDKTILITGASSGMGRASAIYLDSLGARTILIGRNESQLKNTQNVLHNDSMLCVIDLAEIDKIEEIVKPVVKSFGILSGYVHCAGISENRPLSLSRFEKLHRIMLTNFYSFYELTRVLTKKGMYAEEGMSIVAVSSVTSKVGKVALSAYGASKAAMNGAMHSMAIELASKKIRVNTILPAAVNTEMIRKYYDLQVSLEAGEGKPMDRQYLGLCQPEYIASAIAFLLSDQAKWITGAEIPVDGGFLS